VVRHRTTRLLFTCSSVIIVAPPRTWCAWEARNYAAQNPSKRLAKRVKSIEIGAYFTRSWAAISEHGGH